MLEFSPDWDPRACYLVVLGCAIISARVQVLGRLALLKQKAIYAWGHRSIWLVFTIYLLLPLALFWMLDRTGAVKDSSLFAALLVGLAYPAILSGGTALKPAEGLAGVFDWLNKAMDNVTTRTISMVALDAQLFERVIVDHLEKNAEARKLVEDLALQYAASRADVLKELSACPNDPRAQAQIAYEYATDSAQGLKPITGILPQLGVKATSPYARAQYYRLGYTCLATALVLAVFIAVISPPGDLAYRIWRITKTGVSDPDLHRTQLALAARLKAGSVLAEKTRSRLVETLLNSGLESKRADRILQLLVADRGDAASPGFSNVAAGLTGALRADAVDVRLRVNYALLLLAEELVAARQAAIAAAAAKPNADAKLVAAAKANFDTLNQKLGALREWKPLATESPLDLERKWLEWHEWWQATSSP